MIPYQSKMLTPWEVKDSIHTIGGNTGMYAHVWGKQEFDRRVNTDYWKDVYSEQHTKWINENFRKIQLDEKWKNLPQNTINMIRNHQRSRAVFDNLAQLSSTP
jgi:hypothetical protein